MCREWWLRRRVDESEENCRLWDEFERVRPVTEPDMTVEDPQVTPGFGGRPGLRPHRARRLAAARTTRSRR